MTWDLGPAEHRTFLAGVYAADNSIIHDAATDRDDMSDIMARFLAGELTGQPDALAMLPERLLPHGNGKSARKRDRHDHDGMQDILAALLAHQPDYLLPEYGQDAGHWLRTVLYNRRRNRIRAEVRHRRIERERAGELGRYGAGTGESAERVYLRIEAEQDIRRGIMRLPKKLAVVAMLMYDDYDCAEIGHVLGITASTARKRAERIRQPRIRAALGLS